MKFVVSYFTAFLLFKAKIQLRVSAERNNIILLLLLLFPLLFAGPLSGNAQQVREYGPEDSMRVGDTFSYTLTLSKDRDYDDVIFPDSSYFESPLEIRARQRFKVTDFKDSLVYHLQYFGTENSRIPPLPVKLVADNDTTTVYSNPVPIHFKTVLQENEDQFRPLKPIFDFARAWWPYIVALILLAILGWYLYKFYKQRQEAPEPKPRPAFQPAPFEDPLKQLENALIQLKSFTFESEEDFKQFYIHLGDTIRIYFENLYRIPALESTSREIIYELERRMIDERLVKQTRNVLREADMVKFAKFRPTVEQTEESLSIAAEFLKVAKANDGPRVERMRRQHQSEMEKQRQRFETETETLETGEV